MGLLDFLTGGGQSNTDPTAAPSNGFANYGGVPLGLRLMAAGDALSGLYHPGQGGQAGMALLAQFKAKNEQDKKDAAILKKKLAMANNIADKLELTNPEMAALARDNPDFPDMYMKGAIDDTFTAKSQNRQFTHADNSQSKEFIHSDNQQKAGFTHADDSQSREFTHSDTQQQAGFTNSNNQQQAGFANQASVDRANAGYAVDRIKLQAELDAKEKLAEQNYKIALANNNKVAANDIATNFFNETGRVLNVDPGARPPVGTGLGIGSTPQQAGTLNNGQLPDATHTKFWQDHYKNKTITPDEAAQFTDVYNGALKGDPTKAPNHDAAIAETQKAYNTAMDNRPKIQRVQTTAAPGAAFNKKIEENVADTAQKSIEAGQSIAGTLGDIAVLKGALKNAPQGWGIGALMGTYVPGYSAASDTIASVVNRLVTTIHAPGSGSQSDLEFSSAFKAFPKLFNTKEGNEVIVGLMEAKANLVQEQSNLFNDMASGKIDFQAGVAKLGELNRRSIISPELKVLLDKAGVSIDTAAEAAAVAEEKSKTPPMTQAAKDANVTPSMWKYMPEEDRALYKDSP